MLSDRNFSPVLVVVQSFQSPSQHPGQHRALQCRGPPSQPRLPGCQAAGAWVLCLHQEGVCGSCPWWWWTRQLVWGMVRSTVKRGPLLLRKRYFCRCLKMFSKEGAWDYCVSLFPRMLSWQDVHSEDSDWGKADKRPSEGWRWGGRSQSPHLSEASVSFFQEQGRPGSCSFCFGGLRSLLRCLIQWSSPLKGSPFPAGPSSTPGIWFCALCGVCWRGSEPERIPGFCVHSPEILGISQGWWRAQWEVWCWKELIWGRFSRTDGQERAWEEAVKQGRSMLTSRRCVHGGGRLLSPLLRWSWDRKYWAGR